MVILAILGYWIFAELFTDEELRLYIKDSWQEEETALVDNF